MANVNYALGRRTTSNDGGCFAAALIAIAALWRGARTPCENEGMG
jgi:hypothetical protein